MMPESIIITSIITFGLSVPLTAKAIKGNNKCPLHDITIESFLTFKREIKESIVDLKKDFKETTTTLFDKIDRINLR